MPSSAQRNVRPYLSAPQRRQHLLDSAAKIVRESGWAAVSMQGVAVAAGVSRQLVYEHFAAVDELHSALLVHLFEAPYLATLAIVQSPDPRAAIRQGYEMFLDLPDEQRSLLRALASDERSNRPEVARVRRRLRRKLTGSWSSLLVRLTGLPEAEARALAWMLIMAAWASADLVSEREIERAAAADGFVRLAVGAIESARTQRASSEPE